MASTGRTRPIILDSGPGAKLLSAKLSEAEYRGERAKVLRDSASQYLGHGEISPNSHGNATFPDQEIFKAVSRVDFYGIMVVYNPLKNWQRQNGSFIVVKYS